MEFIDFEYKCINLYKLTTFTRIIMKEKVKIKWFYLTDIKNKNLDNSIHYRLTLTEDKFINIII